jgi:hypothetical protein
MSEDDSTNLSRRTVLGGLTGLAVAGSGLAAVSSSVSGKAGSSISISSSNPGTVSNDEGILTSVKIDPQFTVDWEGFDDVVGKVFVLVEAKVGDGSFYPLYRATPWLELDQLGTTGSYTRKNGSDGGLGPLVVADSDGRPDYSSFDFSALPSSIDQQSYLDGTSLGSASNYIPGDGVVPSDEAVQNNFPSYDAGYYGAAASASVFNEKTDATTKTTPITLRYTVELQRPNLGQLEYSLEDAQNASLPSGYSNLSTSDAKREAIAGEIDGLEASDIDAGNSKLVMTGEPEFTNFDTPSGLTYEQIRTNSSSHPGLLSGTTTFDVNVENEVSTSTVNGDTNATTN